jgi:signal transduction histidine kinase
MSQARDHPGYGRSLLEFQIVVFGSLVVVGVARMFFRPNTLDPAFYTAGAVVLVLVTVATLFWHHSPLLQRFSLLLPLADIAGIRLTVLADVTDRAGGALLLMLPIIWIAYAFGRWGYAICLAVVLATSPSSFFTAYVDFDSDDFSRIVAFPLTILIMAGAAGVSGARIRRKRAELAAQTQLTEQAVRARDDLIEAVTHELRTPLTSILGNAELVQRTSDQQQAVQRRAGVIVRNAEQMETVLADLLLARSTNSSRPELHRVRADVRELIGTSLASSRAVADTRDVTINMTVGSPVWAQVDPHRISQVLDNLLTNAIKYNRIGGSVTISANRDANTVTFAVTDTGGGIAAAERVRVFEPYYRTEWARRSTEHGTGLGLGISRDFARRHGGDLRLAASSADGSRFELSLPLAAATTRVAAIAPS